MHANASWLVLDVLLIGWKSGMNFLSQSCSVETAKPITFRHSNENRSISIRSNMYWNVTFMWPWLHKFNWDCLNRNEVNFAYNSNAPDIWNPLDSPSPPPPPSQAWSGHSIFFLQVRASELPGDQSDWWIFFTEIFSCSSLGKVNAYSRLKYPYNVPTCPYLQLLQPFSNWNWKNGNTLYRAFGIFSFGISLTFAIHFATLFARLIDHCIQKLLYSMKMETADHRVSALLVCWSGRPRAWFLSGLQGFQMTGA